MEPFVCENSDYVFLVDWEEFQKVTEGPLEATLMREGEVPTDKRAVLRFDAAAEEDISFRLHPETADWDGIQRVEVVVNERGYTRFFTRGGQVFYAGLLYDVYVQDRNFVG